MHGLTIDHLLSVSLVTADGRVVTASEAENPDLFWGVRGGGGNFGIVTRFAFRMAPVGPEVLGGVVFWALEDAAAVARHYRDWCAELPDEMTTALIFRRAPADGASSRATCMADRSSPLPVAGQVTWIAASESSSQCGSSGRPLLDLWARRPFVDQQSMLDPSYPHGLWAYLRACDVAGLSDDVLNVALDHAQRIESARSSVTIWQLGGAVGRVGPGETAFGSRSSGHIFNITGATDSIDGFERERAWARDYGAALAPYQTGVYVNFLMDEGDERVRQAYGAARYDRLKALKRHYDPDNFFRLNQNISPA